LIASGPELRFMFVIDAKVVLFLQVLIVVGLPMMLWGPLHLGRLMPLPIIQILAGIMLGPSIFGALAPDAFQFFFRKEVLAGVDTLANIALVLFVFLAGCELDRQILRRSAGKVLQIGVTGVFLPWVAGSLAAWAMISLYAAPGILGPSNNTTLYVVAFGLCMAVTALPVLVIVLRELGFNQKPIGTIALAIGAVDDAILWSALAVLLPFAAGSGDPMRSFLVAVSGGILTIIVLAYVIAPALDRLIKNDATERVLLSCAILVLFLAAAFNEATQLHAAIGAFLAGLLLPEKIRHMAQDRFDTPVTLLLLPFLFLATGLKTTFSFSDPSVWILVTVAMFVCVGGKFLGITLPSYYGGLGLPFSLTLGTLMQCKGLMEIVVVTILYQRGVIGSVTFSALVLVALISTAMTVPLARLCQRFFGDKATETESRETIDVAAEAAGPAPTAAPAAAGGPALVMDDGMTFPLHEGEEFIGRHSENEIRIPDVRVSRRHARIVGMGGHYELHNLTAVRSEPNPILINDVEREHAELRNGDVISLGGVKLRFKAA
jgi:Kef-type K+ transport system membrane component KefB